MVGDFLVYTMKKKRQMQELGIEVEQEIIDKLDKIVMQLDSDVIDI